MRMFSKRILLQLVLLTVLLSVAHAATPEPLVLEEKSSYDLSGRMEILTDPTGKLTIQQAADSKDWTRPVHKRVLNLGFTQSAIWLRFSLSNPEDNPQKRYVSFEYPVTNSVTFYKEDQLGVFQEEQAGSTVLASTHVVPDRHFLFPLSIGPGQTAKAYLRVQSKSGMTFPVQILSEQALSRKGMRDYTIYGVLFGVLALVLLYFIAVGSFLHRRTHIWLALYGVFFGLHMAVRAGFLHLVMPDTLIGISDLLHLIVIGGLYFTGAKFFRIFLDLKNQSKFLDRIMMVFQYLSILFVLLVLFQSPLVTLVSLVLFVINPIFSIGLAFYFWIKGVSNAGFFAVGWIVAHCVSVYDFFRINGIFPYPTFGDWLIPSSFLVTLLFLSAALIRQNAVDHLMAETDPLTHLANRRKFDEALNDEWNRCGRLGSPLSLVMADVDHFKNHNDSFGHRAGDQCLCRIAELLKNNTRRTGDLAVRYGGEEFVLLLPNLDAASAFSLAEKIRNAMGQVTKDGESLRPDKKITISLGVATTIPQKGKKPESLLAEADKALYEAKRAGRNRTVASMATDI